MDIMQNAIHLAPGTSQTAFSQFKGPPAWPSPLAPFVRRIVPVTAPAKEAPRPSSLPDSRPPTNEENIDKSVAYMRSHLAESLTVARLASMAHISNSHFFVLFKKRTGRAPIDYFIRLRMAHAATLLEETEAPVRQIAACVGYDDEFYFSRLFKLANNVAPSVYRRRVKSGRRLA